MPQNFYKTVVVILLCLFSFAATAQETRPAAVAGGFYPAGAEALQTVVANYMSGAKKRFEAGEVTMPKGQLAALIVPHAGYVYSGPVAATGYHVLAQQAQKPTTVLMIGPAHHVRFNGLATSPHKSWQNPLGDVATDEKLTAKLENLAFVNPLAAPHAREHSLEVQLGFLKHVLGENFKIVPVVTGETNNTQIAKIIKTAMNHPHTLVVISSDLSHYLPYEGCKQADAKTIDAVKKLTPEKIAGDDACGSSGIRGLLYYAARHGLKPHVLDVRNSGDTAGSKDRVVGYATVAFTKGEIQQKEPINPTNIKAVTKADAALLKKHGDTLLEIAAGAVLSGFENNAFTPPDLAELPAALKSQRASFVTLEKNGQLRGCIGTILGTRPLAEDVASNAFSAAFKDGRFTPLESDETGKNLAVSISLLTDPVPLDYTDRADLLAKLTPEIDGVILSYGKFRSVYLPVVWEQIADPDLFMRHLVAKAGLPPGFWSDAIDIKIFRSTVHKQTTPEKLQKLWNTEN